MMEVLFKIKGEQEARELRNSFPRDGDICNLCGGVIKWVGKMGYEEFFKCTDCGEEWCYD